MTLELAFGGWFQCRLATDPDPYDEPAGVSGTTAAMAWEPPLDRVIRFQRPVSPRRPAPEVGVAVRAVRTGGANVPYHPLVGAQVDLLDEPTFDGRNGLLFDDGAEPIVPFVLRIAGGGTALERTDSADPAQPGGPPDRSSLAHRIGGGVDFEAEAEVLRAIGVASAEAWRAERAAALEAQLAGATDPTRRAGLELRLEMLRPISAVRVTYRFLLGLRGGRGTITDATGALGPVDVERPWPLTFWLGGWDQDAMLGYVAGKLELPRPL